MTDAPQWIPIAEAVALLEPHYAAAEAKSLIIKRISDDTIKIRIARLITSSFRSEDDSFEKHAIQLKNNCEERPIFYDNGHVFVYHGEYDDKSIDYSENSFSAYGPYDESNRNWITIHRSRNFHQYYADWELSEFKSASLSWPSPEFADYFLLRTSHAIGIDVEAEFVRRLIPISSASKTKRIDESDPVWKYDWLGAFAHVAATCRFDDVIGDVMARGALAEIEDILKGWFAVKPTGEPSEAAIRSKAQVLLSAMKQKANQP